MRTKLLKATVVFALLAILLGMPLLLTPHRICRSSFVQIKTGMTFAQVEEILGAQAGNYDGYGSSWATDLTTQPAQTVLQEWSSRQGFVRIYFVTGRVDHIGWGESVPVTWWAKHWHRVFPPRGAVRSYVY